MSVVTEVPHSDAYRTLDCDMRNSACQNSEGRREGFAHSVLDAQAYVARTHDSDLSRVVREIYERLASQYEVIVIEGDGSADEVNLRDRDLVNWPVVAMADAQVMLVRGGIDRG